MFLAMWLFLFIYLFIYVFIYLVFLFYETTPHCQVVLTHAVFQIANIGAVHLTNWVLSPRNDTNLSSCLHLLSLFSFLPKPVATQLSTISVIHGHNVVSVFLKQMSLKTIFMTHTTYTLSSAWKCPSLSVSLALTQTVPHCQKLRLLGSRGILTRNEAKKKSVHLHGPTVSWTTPWDEWKRTNIGTLNDFFWNALLF